MQVAALATCPRRACTRCVTHTCMHKVASHTRACTQGGITRTCTQNRLPVTCPSSPGLRAMCVCVCVTRLDAQVIGRRGGQRQGGRTERGRQPGPVQTRSAAGGTGAHGQLLSLRRPAGLVWAVRAGAAGAGARGRLVALWCPPGLLWAARFDRWSAFGWRSRFSRQHLCRCPFGVRPRAALQAGPWLHPRLSHRSLPSRCR